MTPNPEITNTRPMSRFRFTVEVLDEEYTDHWKGEWKNVDTFEMSREAGLTILSNLEMIRRHSSH